MDLTFVEETLFFIHVLSVLIQFLFYLKYPVLWFQILIIINRNNSAVVESGEVSQSSTRMIDDRYYEMPGCNAAMFSVIYLPKSTRNTSYLAWNGGRTHRLEWTHSLSLCFCWSTYTTVSQSAAFLTL